jgi:hypothetical protein
MFPIIIAGIFWFSGGWTNEYEICFPHSTVVVGRQEFSDIGYFCRDIYSVRNRRNKTITHVCIPTVEWIEKEGMKS